MDLPILAYSPDIFFTGQALVAARAIRQNDLPKLQQLLSSRQVDPNQVGKDGMTLLLWTYEHQLPECLRVLVKNGADVNQRLTLRSPKTGNNYNTHLIDIAVVGPSDQMVLALLALGADPKLPFQEGEPSLHHAVMGDRYDRMRLLVEHGADVNMPDGAGRGVIVSLASLNQFDQVVWLIEHGADFRQHNDEVALLLQETGANAPENQAWQQKLKKILIEKGVHFPITRPYERQYIPIEAQWAKTPEGKLAQDNINRLGADPNVVAKEWKAKRKTYMESLKAWMAANNIAEPPSIPEEDSEHK